MSVVGLTAFAAPFFIVRFWKRFRSFVENLKSSDDRMIAKLKSRISILEERRSLEVDYYTAMINNLEKANQSVQEEAQALRVSAFRARNLYEQNPSFMSKADIEASIAELAPRLSGLRSALVKIKSRKNADAPKCAVCANGVSKNMRTCSNSKCTYEWCVKCDTKIKSSSNCRCPGCRGPIIA